MTDETILNKLESIARCVERIAASRLARAVGFRNISVHEYDDIDWTIVFTLVTGRLDDFRTFAAAIRRYVGDPGAAG